MKRCLSFVLLLILAGLLAGCGGSDKDRGVNKDKDKPQAQKDAEK